jgi:Putative zinc-finger
MSHRDFESLLGEYAEGALDRAAVDRLEAHLADCDECREWLAAYRQLRAELACEPCPAADLLAEYAVGAVPLAEVKRSRVERHLEACPDCRADLELVRAAVGAARPAHEQPRVPARHRRLAVAASVILVVAAAGGLILRERGLSGARGGYQVADVGERNLFFAGNVADGDTITLRASETVALGEGFSVGSGASLTIELASADARSKPTKP